MKITKISELEIEKVSKRIYLCKIKFSMKISCFNTLFFIAFFSNDTTVNQGGFCAIEKKDFFILLKLTSGMVYEFG